MSISDAIKAIVDFEKSMEMASKWAVSAAALKNGGVIFGFEDLSWVRFKKRRTE